MSNPKVRSEDVYEIVALVKSQRPDDDRYPFAVLSTAAACAALEMGYTAEQFEKAVGILASWYRKQYNESLS